jgi:hypothetical protein
VILIHKMPKTNPESILAILDNNRAFSSGYRTSFCILSSLLDSLMLYMTSDALSLSQRRCSLTLLASTDFTISCRLVPTAAAYDLLVTPAQASTEDFLTTGTSTLRSQLR